MNLTNATLLTLIFESDFISKIMLLILFCMSIICWALTLYLFIMLKDKTQNIKLAQFKLSKVSNLEELTILSHSLQNTYIGSILSQYIFDFKRFIVAKPNEIKLEDLQENLYQTFDNAIQEEESLIPVLSTIAQAAPLVGLLGTIWGLIHSFIGIAQQSSADISAVAPGIAEALITTLAGLLVAIPALIMFNFMQSQVRNLEQKLLSFTNSCFNTMKSIKDTDSFISINPKVVIEKELNHDSKI